MVDTDTWISIQFITLQQHSKGLFTNIEQQSNRWHCHSLSDVILQSCFKMCRHIIDIEFSTNSNAWTVSSGIFTVSILTTSVSSELCSIQSSKIFWLTSVANFSEDIWTIYQSWNNQNGFSSTHMKSSISAVLYSYHTSIVFQMDEVLNTHIRTTTHWEKIKILTINHSKYSTVNYSNSWPSEVVVKRERI